MSVSKCIKDMEVENNKLKKDLRFRIMLTTAIVGLIATAIFVANVDLSSDIGFKLVFGSLIYYPLAFLVIAGGFRWKWKNNAPWIATLANLPVWVILIGLLIFDSLEFLKWYAIVGITASIMIFEYNILD